MVMHGRVDWVYLHGGDHIESGLLKPQAQTASTREQVHHDRSALQTTGH